MSNLKHGRGDSRSNGGKALSILTTWESFEWFHSQPAETVQNWNLLTSAFTKEYYSPGKTQSLRNKIGTFA
jgi:hypothetical protein